ncbi:unnamed protein product [Acanthosepion pharaonis]|uniref:Uncharacterized protein n=1 Tax=Acanthosepion pharaonis TaxID=158019 RepID=A0A812B8U3_ACAPH|nr:unnamed protein product [Sepia pharaonis]
MFQSFSEEKIDSGCGSQNSIQDSQDFLSDLYPSQTTRMYQKYVNEPPLYKSTGQVDLHNKITSTSSYQNLDYRKLKGKENDDRTLVTAVVNAIKDSSSEVKENLQQIFRNISELLSKNDGNVEQISERFGHEFQKQHEKLLSVFEVNNQHKQEIAEKEHQLYVLNEQMKSLEIQNCLEFKITEIITEKLSAYKSYINDRGEDHNCYDPRKKCRMLKRRARYLMNSKAATSISPFVSPALTLISHTSSPGVSVKEINLHNTTKPGNEMMQRKSWHVQTTKSVYKKFWDL